MEVRQRNLADAVRHKDGTLARLLERKAEATIHIQDMVDLADWHRHHVADLEALQAKLDKEKAVLQSQLQEVVASGQVAAAGTAQPTGTAMCKPCPCIGQPTAIDPAATHLADGRFSLL